MNRSDSPGKGCLTIEHLDSLYLVPHEHPAPQELRWRLDTVMRRQLVPQCRRLLPRISEWADTSVWLIRRLEVDLALDAGALPDELLARTWAQGIVDSLTRAIARSENRGEVMHFPHRAAFLAHFVGDLAEGRAWDQWYYRVFDSLRDLPAGAAIRQALVREPEQTEAVLLRLAASGRLEVVMNSLSEGDAEKIGEICLPSRAESLAPPEMARIIDALMDIWPTAAVCASAAGMRTATNLLRLMVATRTRHPHLPADGALRSAGDNLLGLAEILGQATEPHRLITCLAAEDWATAAGLMWHNSLKQHWEVLEFFQQLAASDGRLVSRAAALVGPLQAAWGSRVAESPPTVAVRLTPFAGIFLLLPSVLSLQLEELFNDPPYPNLQEVGQPAALLRHLLALKCLGRLRAGEAIHDPVLLQVAGLTDVQPRELLSALDGCTAAMDRTCLRRLLKKLAEQGRIDGRCLVAELVPRENYGTEVLLIRDAANDAWLYAACPGEGEGQLGTLLLQGLDLLAGVVGRPWEYLVLDPSIGSCLDQEAFASETGQTLWLDPPSTEGMTLTNQPESSHDSPRLWARSPRPMPQEDYRILVQFLGRARPAAQELAYFSLSGLTPPICDKVHFDLTWSLVAHAVLRNFSSRLMGFAWSSAEYLYGNFLEGMAAVRLETGRIEVQLPLSPLNLVLRLAGMDSQSYNLPWLNETQVTLVPAPKATA